jgi:hypothetical protein
MSLALSSNLATASVAARRSTVRPTRAAVSIAPAAPLRFAGARRVGMTRVARRHTSTLRVQARCVTGSRDESRETVVHPSTARRSTALDRRTGNR